MGFSLLLTIKEFYLEIKKRIQDKTKNKNESHGILQKTKTPVLNLHIHDMDLSSFSTTNEFY